MWILIFLTVVVYIITGLAIREVWGLRGGYGKGVWCNSSTYMRAALEHRSGMIFASIFITILWGWHFIA